MINKFKGLLSGRNRVTLRDGNPPVFHMDENDPELLAAIETARSRVGWVIMRLQEYRGPKTYLSVKFELKDNFSNAEHIWIDDVEWKDNKFVGKLGNEPLKLKGWTYGETVSVDPEIITDWVLIEDGRVEGNFTYEILVKRASGIKS